MSVRQYWIVLISLVTLIMTITPAYAAPSLSFGKQATYKLSGLVQMDQSCTGSPVAYATQACNGSSQYQFYTVSIFDNGSCPVNGNGTCFFSPNYLTISQGSTVQWFNKGSMSHTVTSNNTLNAGLPSFDSGALSHSQMFTYTFGVPGAYAYYCTIHPWLKGTIFVMPQSSSVQPPRSVKVGLDGTLSWTVKGLGNDTANLQVNHTIGVSISPIPGLTITPVTETGSFEQSITLSTRTESPGTATSILKNLLATVLRSGYLGSGYIGTTSSAMVVPSFLGQATTLLSNSNNPDYTMWWVNGPLTLSSPVQIMTGSSSVTADESLNLGAELGTRSAWVVTSDFSQAFNLITSPSGYGTNASFDLSLLWSYDKQADILLRTSMNTTVVTVSSSQQQVMTGNPCLPNGWCPSYMTVSAIRTMRMTVGLNATLDSTNLTLNTRTTPDPARSSSLGTISGLVDPFWPAVAVAVGIVLAGTIGYTVWYTRRPSSRRLETPNAPAPPS